MSQTLKANLSFIKKCNQIYFTPTPNIIQWYAMFFSHPPMESAAWVLIFPQSISLTPAYRMCAKPSTVGCTHMIVSAHTQTVLSLSTVHLISGGDETACRDKLQRLVCGQQLNIAQKIIGYLLSWKTCTNRLRCSFYNRASLTWLSPLISARVLLALHILCIYLCCLLWLLLSWALMWDCIQTVQSQ